MAIPDATLIRLEKQLESLDVVLRGASPALLDVRSPSGEWSARENLAHLARHAKVFLDRLERVLRGDTPDLGTYRAEKDPEWPAWSEPPATTILERCSVDQSRHPVLTGGARAARHDRAAGPLQS